LHYGIKCSMDESDFRQSTSRENDPERQRDRDSTIVS